MTDEALELDRKPESAVPAYRAIRVRNAVALYVSSVLGPGVLVLPGLTARLAGPAVLIAWAALAVASLPFALTFSSLSARRPEAGGVYAFAREAFGGNVARATGWLFALWMVTGAPAVALIAASYLDYAVNLGRAGTYILAFGIILAAALVNYRGIRFSSKVQFAVIASIVGLLVLGVVVATFRVQPSNFQPFAPYGVLPIGTAAALAFWSFLGYENVSNVADQFVNPQRDFRRSVGWSVLIVGVLYFAITLVTVGTGAYKTGGGVAPFAVILGGVLGPFAIAGTAILAVVIVFATVNAYTGGMARVAYATARDDGFPRKMGLLEASTGVPANALVALFGASSIVFALYYALGVDLTLALLVPSGAAITIYLIGAASGAKIYLGEGRSGRVPLVLALVTFGVSAAILPFVGWPLVAAALALIGSTVYGALVSSDSRTKLGPGGSERALRGSR